ncbi:hypothetical protein ACEQ8H_006215 [Pleosporales sp. CAS-2024a]
MDDITPVQSADDMLKYAATIDQTARSGDSTLPLHVRGENAEVQAHQSHKRRRMWARKRQSYTQPHFRVYKRRWFGLGQFVLLNTVASWDWLTFAPVSTSSALYFNVSESDINWLSTASLFAFAFVSPLVIYLLHRGPKHSILAASAFLLVGNWVRYAGTRTKLFGLVMFGQILTGFAQPFVLAAPTRYSDMWFTAGGRVGSTALASLANPLGGALAQIVNPSLGNVDNMVLIVSVIASVACIPSLFIPAAPPTPPTASSDVSKISVVESLRYMGRSRAFYIVFFTFSIYIASFNAFSTLLNQVLYPYGYTEDEAGICGAILIVVGLVAAAIVAPILDRTHTYMVGIKILCPLVSAAYVAMIWAPQTRTLVAPYLLSAVLGAASFSLLPVALEYLVEITFPASPEVSSTICWVGGQVFGGIFIIIMTALKDATPVDLEAVQHRGRASGGSSRPPGNMYNALVFQAVAVILVLPLPLMLGFKRLGLHLGKGRLKVDEQGEAGGVIAAEGSASLA